MKNTLAITFGGILLAFAAWAWFYPVFHKGEATTNALFRTHNYVAVTVEPLDTAGDVNIKLTSTRSAYYISWFTGNSLSFLRTFKFDVRDAQGNTVQQTQLGKRIFSDQSFASPPPLGSQAKNFKRMAFGKISPQVIQVNLGNIFQLKPGTYTIKLTIMPEDNSSPTTTLVVKSKSKLPTLTTPLQMDNNPPITYTES